MGLKSSVRRKPFPATWMASCENLKWDLIVRSRANCREQTCPIVFAPVAKFLGEDYPYNSSAPAGDPGHGPPSCKFDKRKVIEGSVFSNVTSVPGSAGAEQIAAFLHHNGPLQAASRRCAQNSKPFISDLL